MRYFYKKQHAARPLYGHPISLNHPVYKMGTLFEKDRKGLVITQLRFQAKYAYWDAIDYWVANDIYLHPKFEAYFSEHAQEKNYPVFQLRSVMWALRMKPLPKEDWERYF